MHALLDFCVQNSKLFIIFNYNFFFLIGKTKRGELSIFPRSFTVLSHCLHMMPRQKPGSASDNAILKVSSVCFVTDLVLLWLL